MEKVRTTVTLDDEVLRVLKVRAAGTGKRDSEVIEEPLRRELGLDLFELIRWKHHSSSPDPGDDHLIALASRARATLVSGDDHLLGIGSDGPILSPRAFLELRWREDSPI